MNKYIKIYVITGLALSLWACEGKQENTGAINEPVDTSSVHLSHEQCEVGGITTGLAQLQTFDTEIIANGSIEAPPQNLATISAPMGGYVTETNVLPGSHVHKGQILAELKHQDYVQLQQDYLLAVNKLAYTEKEFERQKEMNQKNVTALRDFQAAETDFKNTKATLAALEEKIKLLGLDMKKLAAGQIVPTIFIRSPLNGDVKSVNVSLGKYVSPMDVMYEIVDNSHTHIELKVFEKDILKVKEGQKILFTVPTTGPTVYKGKVYLLGKAMDMATRTVTVHGHLDENQKNPLLPGMYVEARIITEKTAQIALPEDAIIKQADGNYVFKVLKQDSSGSTFKKVKIHSANAFSGFYPLKGIDTLLAQSPLVLSGAYSINAQMNMPEEE